MNEREKILKAIETTAKVIEQDSQNYKDRKIGRNKIDGLTLSTAFTSDEGYETAIGDSKHFYPVERYTNKEDAKAGHEKWIKKIPGLKVITMLEAFEGLLPKEIIILKR